MVYKDGDIRRDSTASRKHGNVRAESRGGQGGNSICDLLWQEMSRRVWGLPGGDHGGVMQWEADSRTHGSYF